jgi:ZIP family zinc transporter
MRKVHERGSAVPTWLEAGLWGLLGGGALVIGALIAWLGHVPQKVVASVMAFGAGVLISAVAFDLVEEAARTGGLVATACGFLVGAIAYLAANLALARRGARHRKRSGDQRPSESEQAGSGTAIAIGALLDGVPESVVLGMGLLTGGSVSVSVLAAVFISNIPEGLSSAAGMKRNGRSARYVFGVWVGIALISGLAALLGYVALGHASPESVAVITAVAAGAILTMIADTMIPEAFQTRTPGRADRGRRLPDRVRDQPRVASDRGGTAGLGTAPAAAAVHRVRAHRRAPPRRPRRPPSSISASSRSHRASSGMSADLRRISRTWARRSSSGTPRRSKSPSVKSSSVLFSGRVAVPSTRGPSQADPQRRPDRRLEVDDGPIAQQQHRLGWPAEDPPEPTAGPASCRRRPAPRGRPARSPSRARTGRRVRGRPGAARRPAPPGGRRRCPGPVS